MLILLVCACPVYHCVICVYAIRSLDHNFPINTYLLDVVKKTLFELLAERGLETARLWGAVYICSDCNSVNGDGADASALLSTVSQAMNTV